MAENSTLLEKLAQLPRHYPVVKLNGSTHRLMHSKFVPVSQALVILWRECPPKQ
jgi:hypothetical protein